ncbi:unnamed protein product [Paramecium sonneborni]|uniref:RING-type domain-containing protein n=1 Tax=Paramecium sonneborni TaxID=65129 RepID=A0A8S1R8H8_9CILI|nr:unnamed protein product [Paramecium sonneborni]
MELPICETDLIRNLIIDPKSINQNLQCILCKQLVVNPKECEECQNLFCSSCIDDWLKAKQTCPGKCKNFLATVPHRLIRDAIGQIIVKCKNINCNKQMTLSSLENHIKNCEHTIQICNNQGCQKQISLNEMKDHKNNCQFRIVTCEKCNSPYSFQIKHDCIISLNDKIKQLEIYFELLQISTQKKIADLLERVTQCEKQKIKDNKPKCNQGHDLKWVYPAFKYCENCKQANIAVRYQCTICFQNYCQKCRKPQFKEGFCPLNHPLQFSLQAIKETHCDYCNLNIFSRGESVYSDRLCDLDICNSCYEILIEMNQ